MKKIISLVGLTLAVFASSFSAANFPTHAEEESPRIEKVEGIMDSLTFTNPIDQSEVESVVADLFADKQWVQAYYKYDSNNGNYSYYYKESTKTGFERVASLEELAVQMFYYDIYVINATYTTVTAPSNLEATLAKSFDEANDLLTPIDVSMLQVLQIMKNSNLDFKSEEYYFTLVAYGKNDDGTSNVFDCYNYDGLFESDITELEINFEGEVPEYLCVITIPKSGISPWIIVAICVVVLAGAYFALGFTLYKKGKLAGKFFATIYGWIKK